MLLLMVEIDVKHGSITGAGEVKTRLSEAGDGELWNGAGCSIVGKA